MSGQIFISYRRDDSSGSTGRLFDRLIKQFGADQIFMDVDTIEPGIDFVRTIEEAVAACDVLIAVIGTRWLVSSDQNRRWLDNPEDFVRLEIAAALKRDIRVIPVLIEDVSMPSSRELPDDLKPLTRRSAVELSHTRFNADADRLVEAIERALRQARVKQGAAPGNGGAPTVPPAQSSVYADECRIEEMRERPTPERKRQEKVPPLRAGPSPAAQEVLRTRQGRAPAISKPIIVAASILVLVLTLILASVLWYSQQQKPAPLINTPLGSGSRQAKLGEELSTHEWIFQVRSVREADQYAERYYQTQKLIRPQGENDSLIVIDARLTNRLQRTQSPVLTESQPGNTGLVDDAGHSYQPIDYDARQEKGKLWSWAGAPLLPGALADFALVFSVPKGTKPSVLVFTLRDYDHMSTGTDVQVSLKK